MQKLFVVQLAITKLFIASEEISARLPVTLVTKCSGILKHPNNVSLLFQPCSNFGLRLSRWLMAAAVIVAAIIARRCLDASVQDGWHQRAKDNAVTKHWGNLRFSLPDVLRVSDLDRSPLASRRPKAPLLRGTPWTRPPSGYPTRGRARPRSPSVWSSPFSFCAAVIKIKER